MLLDCPKRDTSQRLAMNTPTDRVRAHTADEVLRRIDDLTIDRLTRLADAEPTAAAAHLDGLDHEWDTDRFIEAEASITGLVGLGLATFVDRRFLAIPGIVGAAVFLHALRGWYPLLPMMRRLGLRSAREIARERYALKALRGDFTGMGADRPEPDRAVAPTEAHA
jgi:hypothetical protein